MENQEKKNNQTTEKRSTGIPDTGIIRKDFYVYGAE